MAEDVDLATRVPLYVETTGDATETILTVEGELDMSGIDSFTACAAAVLQNQPGRSSSTPEVCRSMDSSGLPSLLRARVEAAQAGAAFRISDPLPPVRHLLERATTSESTRWPGLRRSATI